MQQTLSSMERNDRKKKSFWNFLEEDDQNHHHSPFASEPSSPFDPHRRSSATAASLPSSPCGSPWTLFPLRRSPLALSPSLLYHCLATLQRHDGNVLSIAVANGLIFTGSDSDRVRIWKQPNCVDRGHIGTGYGMVRAMLAHDDTLFTAHKDHRIRAWTLAPSVSSVQPKKIATFPPRKPLLLALMRPRASVHRHQDTITCLSLYSKEGLLYSGSVDRTVKAWKLTQSRCVDCFHAHEGAVSAMAVSQGDGSLFTGSSDGTVKVWRRVYGDNSHAAVMVLRFQPSPVNALVLGSSGFLYSGSSDGYVNVWEKEEAVSGRYRHAGFLQGHRFAVLCLAAAGRLVMSGSEDTTIRVWRREGCGVHACVAVMEGHRGPVRCMAACVEAEGVGEGEGEGLLLYSASLDRMVKVWRMKVVLGKGREEEEDDEEEEREEVFPVGYEMSPVLSPTWVEKKRIHGGIPLLR